MRSLTCLAGLVLVMLLGATACAGSSSSEAVGDCLVKAKVIFWGGSQWVDLAKALAADPSECAEYYISIPPEDADKTLLRDRAAFNELRTFDPRIHPVAEIRFTGETGWRAWVVGPHPDWAEGRTFYEAGVEARRRMARVGLDVADGETWALNELAEDVLENVPGRRAEIREFLHGLYDGEPDMPKGRGIVFNIFVPSDIRNAKAYKARLEAWLTDESFWSDLDTYVDFFAEEVYASPLTWGVAGAPLATRAEHLNDYFFHMTILAEEGPASVEAARKFLRRTYVPLTNAAWPHAGIGQTNLISAETMSHFVSMEIYAIRNYVTAHPETTPQDRIGFAWAPVAADPGYSKRGRNMILTRLASAIRAAYEEEANSQLDACGPTGQNVWCTRDVDGAFLNDAWKTFTLWE
jgi:hypothetical protein